MFVCRKCANVNAIRRLHLIFLSLFTQSKCVFASKLSSSGHSYVAWLMTYLIYFPQKLCPKADKASSNVLKEIVKLRKEKYK